ncbi:hypothetical protein CDL12_04164 [Handroanthus impetiginosus]|uniref:Uncharacterized protein n=1 Tax=Handroanthus impetiginosus TaxID=429701 RepID=A0A2G9I020_9LAMI|nr:hypothetical protein CDL12_04164 [Handroanthus impetiginosus]
MSHGNGFLFKNGVVLPAAETPSVAAFLQAHPGGYVPSVFGVRGNVARLAIVGRGRDFANAKYSDWVRLRKHLEKLRPPSVTELLLSNDGEHILEGCVTNFFVVCLKDKEFEVQTAPIIDGVLPGIIRQVIRELVP